MHIHEMRLDELTIQQIAFSCLRFRSQNCLAVLLDYTFYSSAGYSEKFYLIVIKSCIYHLCEVLIANPQLCGRDIFLNETKHTFLPALFLSPGVQAASLIMPTGKQSDLLSRDFQFQVLTYMFRHTVDVQIPLELFCPIFAVTVSYLIGNETMKLFALVCACARGLTDNAPNLMIANALVDLIPLLDENGNY